MLKELVFETSCCIHFQVATNAKGRGVLRLLLVQQQINLLCIPALCLQLFAMVNSSQQQPRVLCLILEILYNIVTVNRVVSDMAVSLGR